MQESRLDWKNPTTTMLLGLIFTVLTYASGRLVSMLAVKVGWDPNMTSVITRTLLGLGFIVALGGKSWLRFDLKAIRDSWVLTLPFVMINVVLATIFVSMATVQIVQGQLDAATYFGGLGFVTILCVFVGINEEAMFRGLMFGGLLAAIGNKKNGPLMAAIISSVAFGFLHVVFDLHFDNPYNVVQGLLKTLECGMFGFVLCVSVLETRCLVGAMTVHSFFDWVVLAANGGSLPTTYVSDNPESSIAGIVLYLVLAVLYTPRTIKAYKRLKAMELPQYGPFAQEESAPLANTARHLAAKQQEQTSENDVPAKIGRLRDNRLLNNKYLTIIGIFAIFFIVINICCIPIALLTTDNVVRQVCAAILSIVLSIALAFWYQHHFADEFDGMLGWSTTGLLLGLPCLTLCLGNMVEWGSSTFNNPLLALVLGLAPGISEEILYRGIPGSNWMRLAGEKEDVLPCVLVTGLAFGLVHSSNLLAGASISATIFQIIYAACIGVAFQAVFLRSGSIWGPAIIHTIIDATYFLTANMNNLALSKELVFDLSFYLTCASAVVSVAWGLYLIRPQKRDEIVALWKRKWHKA